MHTQPSTLTPQSTFLWSRQPGEPAADYLLFVGWLQQPSPRPLPKAAAALGCSLRRLRQVAARHRWKTRAAALDNHRADAASIALEKLLGDEAADWSERAHRFRLQMWRLHEQIMIAAHQAAQDFIKHPRRASLREIARVGQIGSELGRRACDLPLDPASDPPTPNLAPPDLEHTLHKIYGRPAETKGETKGDLDFET